MANLTRREMLRAMGAAGVVVPAALSGVKVKGESKKGILDPLRLQGDDMVVDLPIKYNKLIDVLEKLVEDS